MKPIIFYRVLRTQYEYPLPLQRASIKKTAATLAFALALTATLNAQNTVYIVDAPSGANQFSWTQLGDAVNALQNGGTLDMSQATPNAALRTIALGFKT